MLHELQRKQAAILLDRTLDHFAIASNVAIVQDEGQATLEDVEPISKRGCGPSQNRQGKSGFTPRSA